jgi:hypothetical protein
VYRLRYLLQILTNTLNFRYCADIEQVRIEKELYTLP